MAAITSATTAELGGSGVTEWRVVLNTNIRAAVGGGRFIGAANGVIRCGDFGTPIADITYPVAVVVGLVGVRKKWAIVFIAAEPVAVDIVVGILSA